MSATNSPEVRPARASALGAAAAVVVAAAILALYTPLFQPWRLHVHDYGIDQLGYITSARVFADTGELRNGVLMPSQIDNPGFRVHMPGHTSLLAASYRLLGWGAWPTVLPGLASYLLTVLLTFLTGARLYGRPAGVLAATLVALFPAQIAYAFTAMAEPTFGLAAMAAISAFVFLPLRLRPWALPLLLAGPFLFRESGAFLALPLGILLLRSHGVMRTSLSLAASVAVLFLLNRWQIATGKVAASVAWISAGGFNYRDATASAPELSAFEWLSALLANTGRNSSLIGKQLVDLPGELIPACLVALVLLAFTTIAGGARRRLPTGRRDVFPLAAGLLMLLVMTLTVVLYDAQHHKLMRQLLFTLPVGAIALAGLVDPGARLERMREAGTGARALARPAAVVLFLVAISVFVTARAAARLTRLDDLMDERSQWLAEIHDEATVIMGPPSYAPSYAVDAYPVTWCMTPANGVSYMKVASRYPIGTVLAERRMTESALHQTGMRLRETRMDEETVLFVYQPAE